MGIKRIFYEKHETKTTTIKGYIDVETEYIQIYKNFAKIVHKINSPTSFKLLHWLLAERLMDDNGLNATKIFADFNEFITSNCGETCRINESTFYRSMGELIDAGAISKIAKGHYLANPNLFWNDTTEQRFEHLKLADKDPNSYLLNPRD